MPFCSVSNCRNKSSTVNRKNAGISFHLFPRDPNIKEKWINATGRKNWFPNKCSAMCSAHFLEHDYKETKKWRKLDPTAVPTVDVWKTEDIESAEKREEEAQLSIDESECQTLREIKLRRRLNKSNIAIQKLKLKVNSISEKCRRKDKKICAYEKIIQELKEQLLSSPQTNYTIYINDCQQDINEEDKVFTST